MGTRRIKRCSKINLYEECMHVPAHCLLVQAAITSFRHIKISGLQSVSSIMMMTMMIKSQPLYGASSSNYAFSPCNLEVIQKLLDGKVHHLLITNFKTIFLQESDNDDSYFQFGKVSPKTHV